MQGPRVRVRFLLEEIAGDLYREGWRTLSRGARSLTGVDGDLVHAPLSTGREEKWIFPSTQRYSAQMAQVGIRRASS